ncbi:MAG: Ig-like domain-containing protein [Planctomycetaceae bacterium]|jgi:hypothetical protein|nr:Ig-like domain-containing protein [Planctomycetaceae bacterium]
MRTFLLFYTLTMLLFFVGCGGVPVPDELKNLCPVTITVTDGDQAIEGIAVSLSAETSGGAWASRGVTNEKGVAVIQTLRASYTGKGAPAGDYKVTLIKTANFPPELEPQETDQNLPPQAVVAKEKKRNDFLEKNRIIPKSLELSDTSPVKLTVTSQTGATLIIDLSQYKKQ